MRFLNYARNPESLYALPRIMKAIWLQAILDPFQGYEEIKKRKVLTTNMIVGTQALVEKNQAGIRKLPGTVLRNEREVVYTPPVGEGTISSLLHNLEQYINEDIDDIDPYLSKYNIKNKTS